MTIGRLKKVLEHRINIGEIPVGIILWWIALDLNEQSLVCSEAYNRTMLKHSMSLIMRARGEREKRKVFRNNQQIITIIGKKGMFYEFN